MRLFVVKVEWTEIVHSVFRRNEGATRWVRTSGWVTYAARA